jgi:hypothetical protein
MELPPLALPELAQASDRGLQAILNESAELVKKDIFGADVAGERGSP